MNTKIKYVLSAIILFIMIFISCNQDKNYSLGSLSAPSNIAINTEIVGQDTNNPNGDGSGNVKISVTADNALAYKIDYGANSSINLVPLVNNTITKKYTTLGTNNYRITIVAYGKGGSSSSFTKDITVKSVFTPDPVIETNLTNNSSKSWVVDKSVPFHFGVGPWNDANTIWWKAGVDEKVSCCNCFYTTTFTFTKVTSNNSFSLTVNSPDGVFTKTGSLTTLPGIPSSGDEGCYPYPGGTSEFIFTPAATGIPTSYPSTQTDISLVGVNTYIGYGSLQKDYEILKITPTYLFLRVQGTETGNAWYLKLKPASM